MKYSAILFSILFIFCSCTKNSNSDYYKSQELQASLSFERVNEIILTTDNNNKLQIGRLRANFISDPVRNIHVFYDEINKHFLIADNEGNIQRTISSEGHGPGELMSVTAYNIDANGRLVVYDGGQLMLKLFSINGEHLSDEPLNQSDYTIVNRFLHTDKNIIFAPVVDISFLSDPSQAWQSSLIGVYDHSGSLIETFGQYDASLKQTNSYSVFPIMYFDPGEREIFTMHTNDFHIQVYDVDTKERIARFGRKTPNFNQNEESISPQLSYAEIQQKSLGLSFGMGLYATDEFIFAHFENLTESYYQTNNQNEKEQYISIYDRKNFDSYGEITSPYVVGNISNDQIYLIEDDDPDNYTIGIYEIQK